MHLNYDSPATGEGTLEISLRGQLPVSEVQVVCNGKELLRYPLIPTSEFLEKGFPIRLTKGQNGFVVSLLDKSGAVVPNPFVQFRSIRITPPGDTSPMADILRKAKNEVQ